MSKTSIAIIIICTALIAVVIFFSFREEPGIEDIYLISCDNIEEGPLEDKDIQEFSSRNSSIYIIIPVKGVKTGDKLHIAWVFLGEAGNEIIQRDDIEIEDDGSGNIAAYLLKADSVYSPGVYRVRVDYNGKVEKQVSFIISEP